MNRLAPLVKLQAAGTDGDFLLASVGIEPQPVELHSTFHVNAAGKNKSSFY